MITSILFFLLRYYRRHHPARAARIQTMILRAGRVAGLATLCLLISMASSSQEKKSAYIVYRNGSKVGDIQFTQNTAGNRTTLTLVSELETQIIFTITAKAREESIYDSGILTWSSVYRKMNGSEKENKKTKANGNGYVIFRNNKSVILNSYPIRHNMLSMYAAEPVEVNQVYSDVYEKFLDVKRTGNHLYKIVMPDGNSNSYHYENGLLSKLEVSTTFYSASICLKK
jgi:hypothetical protein